MAHKKGSGSTKNGRDSNSKRWGLKKYGGHQVIPGNIIVRQKGNEFTAGDNVGTGKDYTLFSLIEGIVKFQTCSNNKKKVNVYPFLKIKKG